MHLPREEQAEIITAFFPDDPAKAIDFIMQFNEMMMKYHSAIREIKTKFEILNDELSLDNRDNPIQSIKYRTKKPISIVQKLQRMNQPTTLESIEAHLNDVAGIRVICSFIDDIYRLADMLAKQDDITVIAVKDYIKNPKPNGYRSYHMIVEVPVFFSEGKKPMRVEIQIRTVAMDFWASLEHRMSYKRSDHVSTSEISDELKSCAEVIASTDVKMMELRDKIDRLSES